MATTEVSFKEKISSEWIVLLFTAVIGLIIATYGIFLVLTGKLFEQIFGSLLLIAFILIFVIEYRFLQNAPWGWYGTYLFHFFLLIGVLFLTYFSVFLELLNEFYLLVIKGLSTVLINFFAQNDSYTITNWIEAVFILPDSFLTQQSVIIGVLFALIGFYWVLNYLSESYAEYELQIVKRRIIILLVLMIIGVIWGLVVLISDNVIEVLLGALIGSSGFVIFLLLNQVGLKERDKSLLIKAILIFIILILSTLIFISIDESNNIIFNFDAENIIIASVIIIFSLSIWLLKSGKMREKYDVLWTAEQREQRVAFTLIAPTAVVVLVIVLIPVLWITLSSFLNISSRNIAGQNPVLFSGLSNYTKFLIDDEFFQALYTSILYTILGTGLSTFLGLIIALLLNRAFLGRGLIRGVMLFPYIASTVAIVFLWEWALDASSGVVNYLLLEFGLISSPEPWLDQQPFAFIVIVTFEAWKYFPFAMLMILAQLQAINKELYEAADIDGANEWQKFRNITLPELRYVLGVVILLRTIWTFNKFDDVFLFTKGEPLTGTSVIPTYIFDKVFLGTLTKISEAAAVSVVLVIGLLIFSITFGRRVLKW